MNFKYSAIGDNTPENREHLEKVGMEKHPFSHERGAMIATYTDTKSNRSFYLISWKDTDMLKPDIINCIGNPALFRAVTAIRKDSGIHQLYTDGDKWVESDIHDLLEIPDYLIEIGFKVENTHVATLAELQEHFK